MTRRMRIDDLTALAVPSQPALSPDGARVVYVLRTLDARGRPQRRPALDRADRRRHAAAAHHRHQPTPRRPGRRTAPGSRSSATGQVHVLAADGGEPEQVTDLPLGAGAPVWSPDGDRIAFTRRGRPDRRHAARSSRRASTTRPTAPACSARSAASCTCSTSPPATAARLTDGDHAGQPAWSPDGRTVAFTRKVGADSDLTFRTAVHLLDVDDPKAAAAGRRPRGRHRRHRLVQPPTARACWSSATRRPALGHAHLLRVPLDGGEPVDLTGHLDRNVMPGGPAYPGARPVETADGRLLFAIRDRGCSHLWDERRPGPRRRRPRRLRALGRRRHRRRRARHPDVVRRDRRARPRDRRRDRADRPRRRLADVELFVREERTFTISDGTEVQAWLVRDPEREGPLPLLLDVHGGPHNAWNAAADEMHLYHQELAAQGWAVLLVNPRGSDGYGEAFYDGVQGAWGVADANDFLEPIDALVAEGLADPDRLAVTGYSYGGFMTCWLTAHDDRFKAARRRRRRQRPGQHVRRQRRRRAAWAATSSAARRGTRPRRYAAMSPLTRVDRGHHARPWSCTARTT